METVASNFEKAVLVFAAVTLGGGLWFFNRATVVKPMGEGTRINYEMKRPQDELVAQFDLSGREIDREIVDPFVERKPKSLVEEKNTKAQKANNNPPKQSYNSGAKPKSLFVDVVDRSESNQMLDTQDSKTYAASVQKQIFSVSNQNPQSPKEKDEDHLTPNQWRALILAQPTEVNTSRFVDAYKGGRVDAATFYAILHDLLKSNSSQKQILALKAYQATPSFRSFTALAQSKSLIVPELAVTYQGILLSYGQPQWLGILALALESEVPEVMHTAGRVVIASLLAVHSGTVYGRGYPQSVDSRYQRFVNIFRRWTADEDEGRRQIADQFLALLGSGRG
ncbi:MAG: hypothetical protein N2578_05370 [Bdellovibrionaceae bacterium]|nr:hypothetical protein [Pseudobdellovibrionaceae bacterium]